MEMYPDSINHYGNVADKEELSKQIWDIIDNGGDKNLLRNLQDKYNKLCEAEERTVYPSFG